jgi:hypothetical protein
MMDAASVGRLGGFVIDEAHLVTQWGRFFRPEFRTLSDLRRDLVEAAGKGGHIRPATLLLSATLGAAEIEDLEDLFGQPGPFTPIVANALRSETEIWIAQAADDEERPRSCRAARGALCHQSRRCFEVVRHTARERIPPRRTGDGWD